MTKSENLTGILLGAGASYEAGMPLARELTVELLNWLTPEKLLCLNECWRSQGGGYPDNVIADFQSTLRRSDHTYESLLGYLEVQYRRQPNCSQHYHGLYSWLVELVYMLLYYRHTENVDYILNAVRYYDGLSALAEENHPLWIFSLNHDVIVECLAARLDYPLSWGASQDIEHLPRRDQVGKVIGNLAATVLPVDYLERSGLRFLQKGSRGINLIKIHGSLDIFAFRNGKDFLKFIPIGNDSIGPLRALRSVNEELVFDPQMRVRVTNEVIYEDREGEMQFLRRSLLAGAFKFDPRHTQVLSPRFLDAFRTYINYVDALICIGYSFGDHHVNMIVREWLEFDGERQLIVVNPGVSSVPAPFLHVASQIELDPSTATEYLDSCGSIIRSQEEVTERKLKAWIRSNGEIVMDDILSFGREHQMRRIIEWIKELAIRDGDIDLEAMGVTFEQVVEQAKNLTSTPQEVIEEFLKSKNL